MTTRKSKGKGKGNSHGNVRRTKRGGFLAKLFDNSFSWFGNNPKTNEANETNEAKEAKEADSSASGSGTGTSGGWLSGL